MIKLRLKLPKTEVFSKDIEIDISENSSWNNVEYEFAKTDIFQSYGLYFHFAKLWHLVDSVHLETGNIIDANQTVKNIIFKSDDEIFLSWEEDEELDSP